MNRLALAAVGTAVIGLTGCSHSTASSAAHHQNDVAPVSCKAQYHNWSRGDGRGVMGALEGVSSAAAVGNGQRLSAALKRAEPAVAKAARHPIPTCADPRGFWNPLLMHLNAAVATHGTASSVRAAIQEVPQIHHQLLVEVKRSAR